MISAKLTVTQLTDDLWVLNECGGANVDAYLILGSKKALLIDSLMSVPALWDEIRKITSLPLEVIITHGHGDHIGKATLELIGKGCPIYMDRKDIVMAQNALGCDLHELSDISEGMVFELGNTQLELITLAGHTPGSIVLLDRKNKRLFTGDAIGSGDFWMQLPCCLSLEELTENIVKLQEKISGIDGLTLYPGHRHQSPPVMDERYIEDVLACSRAIMDGSVTGNQRSMDFHGSKMEYRSTSYGLVADYCYDPLKIRK